MIEIVRNDGTSLKGHIDGYEKISENELVIWLDGGIEINFTDLKPFIVSKFSAFKLSSMKSMCVNLDSGEMSRGGDLGSRLKSSRKTTPKQGESIKEDQVLNESGQNRESVDMKDNLSVKQSKEEQ